MPWRIIFNASNKYRPEGGTLSTCITQADFEEESVLVDYDSDDDEKEPKLCRFECDCDNMYTGNCRMNEDSAPCYKCGQFNRPMGRAPHGTGQRRNPYFKHSCNRCHGRGHCPNVKKNK